VGVAREPSEFVLVDPGDAGPVFLMTAGPSLEGHVDLGMHGRHRKKQDDDTVQQQHPVKAG
jgi:hypothetical protein